MNDLGVLEVITDDLLCNETLDTSNESEENGKDSKDDDTVKTAPEKESIKEGTSALFIHTGLWQKPILTFSLQFGLLPKTRILVSFNFQEMFFSFESTWSCCCHPDVSIGVSITL